MNCSPGGFHCECVVFQERQEEICQLNFIMDVRERLYLMKRVMEEVFPTIKTVCLSTVADNTPHHAVLHSSC